MSSPEREPLKKLFYRDARTLADLLNRGDMCKILAEDVEDEKQAVAGIRNDKVRKDGVGMSAAFTEYP